MHQDMFLPFANTSFLLHSYIRMQYVTVHAKTSLVCIKNLNSFLAQLIAILNSYLHSMSPMARLNWSRSAFLGGEFTALYGTMTDTLAPVERANWMQPA